MRLKRLAKTFVMIIAIACLTAPVIIRNSAQAETEHIYLALGDSIAAGIATSAPQSRGYPAKLRDFMQAERLTSPIPGAIQLINLAEPGETTESFLNDGQLDAARDRINATDGQELRTITLTIGGNDILNLWDMPSDERQQEFDAFTESFESLIDTLADELTGMETDVVVTTYYDLTEGDSEVQGSDSWWLAEANRVITETSESAGFSVVDLAEVFDGRIMELTWFPADVHPNNPGHQAIARAIWQTLEYDESAPDVTITRPESPTVRSRVPTIHAEISDNVGIESVALAVDGEITGDLLYVARLDAWIGLWDAREYDGDQAELQVIATDFAGNESLDTMTIDLPGR
jgi:lysophospholipase L1-like esterase